MKYSRRLSRYMMPTLKEDPKEAEIVSHKLMIRAGMIRKLASGIYEFLPLGLRVIKKIENIIRQELDAIGGQEILMSALQPKSLWDRSGRWELYGPELMRLTDRKGRDFSLGPTHEEVVTGLVASNVSSYKELPLLLYQFQMKFRDEIRPRFGVMRAREFYMKDAYSFDISEECCQRSYSEIFNAYERIFRRCGLDFVAVEADTGNIGGSASHEFMVLADSGEDMVVVCECGYGANLEKAEYVSPVQEEPARSGLNQLEEVYTPGKRTVGEVAEFLGESPDKFIKTLIYETDEGTCVFLIRGDHELNENTVLSGSFELAEEEKVREITGAPSGFAGPVGLDRDRVFRVVADSAVKAIVNGISGANREDYHIRNINYGRDYKADEVRNIRRAVEGDLCPKCGLVLEFRRGIEVGHTFYLGNKYSSAMGAVFTDEAGRSHDIVMGCYGIGVSRVAAAAIEQSHDSSGIIWPRAIAPFDIALIQIGEELTDTCADIYEKLSRNYEVLWDDRNERPGVKFKDAQLIGIPVQVVVGKKYIQESKLEVQLRNTGSKVFTDISGLEELIENEKDI